MYESGFEQVILDLIFVDNGPDNVRADVTFVVEGFEAAPDAGVFVLGEFGLGRGGSKGVVQGSVGVGIDPLLHLYRTGAVVEFVGYICGLGGNVTDLSNECDL